MATIDNYNSDSDSDEGMNYNGSGGATGGGNKTYKHQLPILKGSQFLIDEDEYNDDDYNDDETDYTQPLKNSSTYKIKGGTSGVGGEEGDIDAFGNQEEDDNDEGDDFGDYSKDGDQYDHDDGEEGDGEDMNGDEDKDEDDIDDQYLKKFKNVVRDDYIQAYHPECKSINYQEIDSMLTIIRDENNNIIDPLHQTDPFLTKYEKTRVLGVRTLQLDNGAEPFINIPENIIESVLIAEMELQQKKIPFIIKRPLPHGGFEFWRLNDLSIIR